MSKEEKVKNTSKYLGKVSSNRGFQIGDVGEKSRAWEKELYQWWGNNEIPMDLEFAKLEFFREFIRNLLQAQRSNLVKEIEGLKKEWKDHDQSDQESCYNEGYNQAIDEVVKNLINSSK